MEKLSKSVLQAILAKMQENPDLHQGQMFFNLLFQHSFRHAELVWIGQDDSCFYDDTNILATIETVFDEESIHYYKSLQK